MILGQEIIRDALVTLTDAGEDSTYPTMID